MAGDTRQTTKVVIIDTGCANIRSVRYAIERLGYTARVSDQPQVLLAADKLFLPGVGTAGEAMKNLAQRNLIETLARIEQPVLGICLGMQLLGLSSAEKKPQATADIPCLGFCQAPVTRLTTGALPLPHMGWNSITLNTDSPLFAGIASGSYFYFVHSFALPVSAPGGYTLASCEYGQAFSAAIQCGQYYGVQFHPERSGAVGARLIRNFLEM